MEMRDVDLYYSYGVILEFIPRDAYLIYALISKAWTDMLKKARFPAKSSVSHFCTNIELITYAIRAQAPIFKLITAAIWHGDMDVVTQIDDLYPRGFDTIHMDEAAHAGNLDILEWLDGIGCVDHDVTIAAAEAGNLQALQWAHAKGYDLTSSTFEFALESGNIEVLEWLRAHGFEHEQYAEEIVAYKGNVETLQWLHDNGYIFSEEVFDVAASEGHVNILQWLHDHGYTYEPDFLYEVTRYGNLNVLQWMMDNGYLVMPPINEGHKAQDLISDI